MYRSYSYNDMPKPVAYPKKQPEASPVAQKKCDDNKSSEHILGIGNDDLILIAVVIILLMDGCKDRLLLAAIAFVLFSDIF
ncbi:MAG: hypothetical protein PUF72_09655 [Clostridiales bacterium]|nr:hypothetical protein [Clostridiales bacterium]